MTDVDKLLALITIQAAAMNKHQRAACNEAWLKVLAEAEKPTIAPAAIEAAIDDTYARPHRTPVFLGHGYDDGDDDYCERAHR